jgi:5-methylcytosine-specific restriction protein A
VHYLGRHPLCRFCEQQGRIAAASVVDHITPHKGDQSLFWDSANWQPLCKLCHDSIKKRIEAGRAPGCDLDGNPLQPGDHWR